MRLPDGRNVATRQAVHGSAPCARTEVLALFAVGDVYGSKPRAATSASPNEARRCSYSGDSDPYALNCSSDFTRFQRVRAPFLPMAESSSLDRFRALALPPLRPTSHC